MNAKATYATGIILLLASCHLIAQETAAQRHEMATNQLKRLAAEMSARCLNDVHTLDDWKKQRPRLRQQLLDMLGLDPLPQRTPLKAQIAGRLERDAYHNPSNTHAAFTNCSARPISSCRRPACRKRWKSGGIRSASAPTRPDRNVRRKSMTPAPSSSGPLNACWPSLGLLATLAL